MAFTLDNVIPWGRTFDEYVRMFQLTGHDLQGKILGCSDGPASFNAEATQQGTHVISCDPIYQFTPSEIESRFQSAYDTVMSELLKNMDDFVWDDFKTPEGLGEARTIAIRRFLADFEQGQVEGRYITASLPELPFSDQQFDIALCSHFLFLYSAHFSLEFHAAAINELCRAAREVRIFPLTTLATGESPYVQPIIDTLHEAGYQAARIRAGYEFQRGGHTMLRIWRD